jgi:hypothetical protein
VVFKETLASSLKNGRSPFSPMLGDRRRYQAKTISRKERKGRKDLAATRHARIIVDHACFIHRQMVLRAITRKVRTSAKGY